MKPTYFVAYLTANDTPYFHIDYFNWMNMLKHHPGVDHIHLYVAISMVQQFSFFQRKLIEAMMQATAKCKWITCEAVILKPNQGRDFSSLRECLIAMRGLAVDTDFILVRNRSSRGPFRDQWYKKYIDQFRLHDNTGLVGSTINLIDHNERGLKANVSHVQSYSFLSTWKHLSALLENFPGMLAFTHLEAVIDGEIELSQKILRGGARISSLQKPEMILDLDSQNDPVQSQHSSVVAFHDLPIIHRKREPRGLQLWINRLGYFKLLTFLVNRKLKVKFIDLNKR